MKRLAPRFATLLAPLLAPLLCLTACVSPSGPPTTGPGTPVAAVTSSGKCRVGPDGGAPLAERGTGGPLADRGIGGTGEPATQRADRGIGGTGGPAKPSADRGPEDRGPGERGPGERDIADRGIGGTGITGIVTGFASVCVDGLEVALDDRAAVDIDGALASRSALRVGQLVAIKAGPPRQAPIASRVSVRHEVSGPVEAVLSVDPGLIVVAGQRVRVPGKAVGSLLVQPGVWVAVSGLRGPDGDIVASRLDPRDPGPVLVHGPLIEADGEASIGSLAIRSRRDVKAEVGTYVTASGRYVDGTLTAETLVPDLLVSNPPAWFGAGTTRLVLESYGQFTAGSATITGGFQAGLASGFMPPRDLSGPVVVSLEAQADGSFAVVRASPAPPPALPAATPGGANRMPGAGDMHPSGAMQAQATASGAGSGAGSPGASDGAAASGTAMRPDTSLSRSYSQRPARQAMHDDGSLTAASSSLANSSAGNPSAAAGPAEGPGGSATGSPAGSLASGGIVYGRATLEGAGRIGGTAVTGGPGGTAVTGGPGGAAASGGPGATARIGGIRIMGAGVAAPGGHAAMGLLAPRAFGLHLTPMRFRPGR